MIPLLSADPEDVGGGRQGVSRPPHNNNRRQHTGDYILQPGITPAEIATPNAPMEDEALVLLQLPRRSKITCDRRDAHCPDAGNTALEAAGEWNESAMALANVKMVCDRCYEQMRERNWLQGGRPRVIVDIVFVGSVSTRSNTWLWSWANGSYLENVKSRMPIEISRPRCGSLQREGCPGEAAAWVPQANVAGYL